MGSDEQRKLPKATIIFIALNVCIWIYLEWIGDTLDSEFMIRHGASYAPFIEENGEYWRLFTCMFLHFGADHLINNMLLLGVCGYRLEYVMGSVCFGSKNCSLSSCRYTCKYPRFVHIFIYFFRSWR